MTSLYSIFMSILIFIATLFVALYLYFKRIYTYWNKYNIPVLNPVIPHGSLGNLFRRNESLAVSLSNAYKFFKDKGERHGGIYILKDPIYLPVDPILYKNILIKDFNSFMDRSLFHNEKDDPLSVNLLTMDGENWKNMRQKLTPTFTSGKMKQMMHAFRRCSEELVSKINEHIEKQEAVDIKEILGCFTTDIIGSCAFGIDCNSLKNPDCEFRVYGKKVFDFSPLRVAQSIFARNYTNLARKLGMVTIPKEIAAFFLKIVEENLRYREENNVRRNDFFQILMDVLDKKEFNDETTRRNKISAQSFVFFNAGFETSSTTMTFAIYELAVNPSIQQKLREEVISVVEKHDGEITYEALMEMEYLNKVAEETLRKHPPIAMIARRCTQNYKIEGSDVVIEKGNRVFFSVLGTHYDPEYYPNPDVFDPDRFNDENKSKRPPCTYLPFGDGPRNCIGLRFGLLQVKIGLAVLVKNFKFSLNPKTGPLIKESSSFINRFANTIYIDFEKN